MALKVGVIGATPRLAARVRELGAVPVCVVVPGTPVEPLIATDRAGYAYSVDLGSSGFDSFVTDVLGAVSVSLLVAGEDAAVPAARRAAELLGSAQVTDVAQLPRLLGREP